MGGRRETDRQIDRWTVKWRKISVCSSVHLFVCLSVQYVLLPALLSIHPSVHPSDCLSVSTYVFQSFGCTYIHLSVPLTARPPARPPARPSVRPSVSISLSVFSTSVFTSVSRSVCPSFSLSVSTYTHRSFCLSTHQFPCGHVC